MPQVFASRALTAVEYRLLIEHSPVMIWRSGLDASCDYFNETWLSFTGRTLEQELGNGWAEGVHPDDLQRCISHYLHHFQKRVPFEMEYRLRRHDGAYRWIFDGGVPFNDDTGAFAGFIGSCVDVDERHQAQEAQQKFNQEQLTLARNFEKWILAIVGHDIRNPLSAIQLATFGLSNISDPAGVVKKNTEVINRGVTRIQNIVGDLLDLSRVREGEGIFIAPKPTDLRAMCQEITEELQLTANDHIITFECDVEGHVVCDGPRVLQAVSNLISNAVQHGKPGTPVRLRLTGDGQRVSLEVENEGVIPDEQLQHLFEPFHSRRHHSKRGDGLGLGLFIAKAIASAHGGCLEVHSSNDSTMFRLILPRGIQDAAAL